MKRSPVGAGRKSLERGSTFNAPRAPLARRNGIGVPPSSKPARGFTPASSEQRAKVAGMASIVSGERPCDPAHLTPRSLGGCDHPDCVIPLTRMEHRAFDDGRLDVLGALVAHGCWAELAHAISAHHLDPISLTQRLTGERWAPERKDAA